MELLATSDKVVCLIVYRHCLTLHMTSERQKSQSSLCMPTYTDKDKETDFPTVQYVGSHMQTLIHLPIHSAFAFTGHLKVMNNCRFCFRLRYRYVLHTVLFTLMVHTEHQWEHVNCTPGIFLQNHKGYNLTTG